MAFNSNKKKVHPLVGKVGYCDAKTLNLKKGHYVFIRRVYGDKCSVNTFTTLKTKKGRYKLDKFEFVENGSIYPVPIKDTTLPRFGGVDNRVIKNIPINNIYGIDRNKLNRRHHHYIQKYVK
ncbi:MAG: hypothetical protein J6C97_01170 [Clostridia bacterium]|nr:hypothetical protein [Clostridia bacterium]